MKLKPGAKLRVLTNQEKISGIFDPVRFLQKNHDEEMLLLESADVVTKRGQKSILLLDLALRVEARNDQVVLKSLLPEALPLLNSLAERFKDAKVASTKGSLTLAIEPLYHHLDLLEKMKAVSQLDVLRMVLSFVALEDPRLKKNFMLSGVFSYDFLDHFEKLPKAKIDVQELPDYLFYLPLTLVVIDHKSKKTSIFAHAISLKENQEQTSLRARKRLKKATELVREGLRARIDSYKIEHKKETSSLEFAVDIPDDSFKKLVDKCKEHINAGDVYQIVPSRTFSKPIKDPIHSYQVLRQMNPSPYMFYVRTHDWSLFGASPETFIKVDKRGSRVSIRPIAGTRRRGFRVSGGIDEELDSREQASLCLDEKELAEHMMLVDLARNDIASVAKPNSRRIKRLLGVDRFSHVMHLVSEVEGELLKGFDALSAYQASMNMGTLMGAPKVRAAELLRKLEATKRGFYGGAVGYIDLTGDMDTAIIIRSAVVKGDIARVRAGCGVVFDSSPQFETQETINKAEAVLRAIDFGGGL